MITSHLMTSRERILLTLNHKEADRVPLDFGGTVVTGISAVALSNYLNFIGDDGNVSISHLSGQIGRIPEVLLRDMGVDVRPLDPSAPSTGLPTVLHEEDADSYYDEWGIGWRMPHTSYYFDMFHHPLAHAESVQDIISYRWPDPNDEMRYRGLRSRAEQLSLNDEMAVIAGRMGPGIFEQSLWLRGFERFYSDLACEPDMACAIMDRVLEIKMEYWSRMLEAAGDFVSVISEADDLCSQVGPLISPAMYRRYIKPRQAALFSHIKKVAPHVKIFFHSCGAVFDLIGDLIETGVDILNPVQTSAEGMDPVMLKKTFGSDIVFWGGGVDTQHVLPRGSTREVRDNVACALDTFAPGGGYVFATIHNIQADVPPQNVEALIEAFHDYGSYR